MRDEMENRCIQEAMFIMNTHATVRQTAKKFGTSKSTVYKDVAKSLWEINKNLAQSVQAVLMYNKAERHLRGGDATKARWEAIKSKK